MDVVFAVLPFADVTRPAIGASLLKAATLLAGRTCRIEYFNLRLAERIGLPLYARLANSFPSDILIGEWFFADTVFGDEIPHEADYIARVLSRYVAQGDNIVEEIRQARRERENFV